MSDLPSVGLPEGATVTCVCGWWGWVHPPAYDSPNRLERDCPDCGAEITVTADVSVIGSNSEATDD